MENNIIKKTIDLKAPVSKVWKALTDYHQFSEWFCVVIDKPFAVGTMSKGRLNYPGYEHLLWEVTVKQIKPETLFSFTWHPYAIDPKRDYSKEPQTLIEFHLKEILTGTRLEVVESGFAKLPKDRITEAFRMNTDGWEEQLQNIERYVNKK